jgi:hypothetical protein
MAKELAMMIPLGPLRLSISLTLAEEPSSRWEMLAAGMEDRELTHLSKRTPPRPEVVRWDHLIHFIGGTQRP